MKQSIWVSVVLFLVLGAFAVSQGSQVTMQKHFQIATPGGSNVGFAADDIQRQPATQTLQLRGNVEIRTHDMALHTNEATYSEKTGEIEARGIVRIKLETQH